MQIEILTTISGVTFEECYASRVIWTTGRDRSDTDLRLDDLKRNKRASGRYKDLDDLEHLPSSE